MRVWDLASVQPRLLAIAPSHACASTKLTGQSLRTCTAIDLVWQHGMLLTGHTRGEVGAVNCRTGAAHDGLGGEW